MRRRLLFVEIEGEPPDGRTAGFYSLSKVMKTLESDLATNTWRVLNWGELWPTEDGDFFLTRDDHDDGEVISRGRLYLDPEHGLSAQFDSDHSDGSESGE